MPTTDMEKRPGAAQPQVTSVDPALMEIVLLQGDLSKLSPAQRLSFYKSTCESLGINPLTKPFEYIFLNGKLVLYPKRDCTDQLRSTRSVSIKLSDPCVINDILYIKAYAYVPNGRADEATGAVSVKGLSGEARANALMKAETKAKRRATLSLCGLGFSDDSELENIPGGRRVSMETAHSPEGLKFADSPKPKALPPSNPMPYPPDCDDEEKRLINEMGTNLRTMLPWFQDAHQAIKEMCGNNIPYYDVLGSFKWEHANKETIKEARMPKTCEVALALIRKIKAIQKSSAEPEPEPPPPSDDDDMNQAPMDDNGSGVKW